MNKQERRRKFHQSLVNILYAPLPSPPQNEIEILEERRETTLEVQHIADELEEEKSSLSASDDETQAGTGKLTRAQRKRLRKKRLKEAALNRRKIIGPELPIGTDIGNDHLPEGGNVVVDHQTQDVRRNAAEGIYGGIGHHPGDTSSCTSQNKRKQRRVSRKLVKEKLKPITIEHCNPESSYI